MNEPVIVVMLRQPRMSDPNEMRIDPLWEFASFGCTGCHNRNLMNPNRLTELSGARLAFAQNGDLGIKLVHLTPPVSVVHHGFKGEVKWRPAEMPLAYKTAPTLINEFGFSDFSAIIALIKDVKRR